MSSHAILAPSSAHRWRYCPGSVMMEIMAPITDDETEQARTGTAAHWVAAELLMGRGQQLPKVAPNGVEIDDEMLEAAAIYVDHVLSIIPAGHPAEFIRIEQPVAIKRVHEQNSGTPDLSVLIPDALALHIWDFKYGHLNVEAERNWQIADYATGLLDFYTPAPPPPGVSWQPSDRRYTINEVHFHVVQPRAFGHPDVKTWVAPASLVRDQLASELRAAALNALSPNATLCPGADHCRDCRARPTCKALQYVVLGLTEMLFKAIPIPLDPEVMGRELSYLKEGFKLYKALIDGLEQQVESMVRRGQRVPGWALEGTTGRLKWTIPDADVIALASAMGYNVAKEPTAITPTQAKRLLPDAVIDACSTRPPGGLKLVKSKGWKG